MSEKIEFQNIVGHTVFLPGPDGTKVEFPKFSRRMLDIFFRRYVPKYLREIRTAPVVQQQNARPMTRQFVSKGVVAQPTQPTKIRTTTSPRPVVMNRSQQQSQPRRLVGQVGPGGVKATEHLHRLINSNNISISNDIGIGILSYNRLHCLRRLVDSIRRHTDLSKTTVFISDESTDQSVIDYLNTITDMVVIRSETRLGIAGNTNRLLRCLARFRYGLLLNDDVEVLKSGWETFYPMAMDKSKFHHFCYRQHGIYNASDHDGSINNHNDISVRTITSKPHGAVLAFTNAAYKKVGYFDESYGPYGMEHVDWSNRISLSGMQKPGFHDVVNSNQFFRIHNESSSIPDRPQLLPAAKQLYESHKNDSNRIRVEASDLTKVPEISYIIPFRGNDRKDSIKTVLQNIKAQKFPVIEIIMTEQDDSSKVFLVEYESVIYALSQNKHTGQPFTKAQAFNLGVSLATKDRIVFHDADMMVYDVYTSQMHKLLGEYEGVHIGQNVLYLDSDSTNRVNSSGKLTTTVSAEKSVKYYEGGSLGCQYNTYIKIGGFNEEFIGYGNEDTEFFARLSATKFLNERSIDLVHLWHGRNDGWTQHHAKNKNVEEECKKLPMSTRMERLRNELVQRYKMTMR